MCQFCIMGPSFNPMPKRLFAFHPELPVLAAPADALEEDDDEDDCEDDPEDEEEEDALLEEVVYVDELG